MSFKKSGSMSSNYRLQDLSVAKARLCASLSCHLVELGISANVSFLFRIIHFHTFKLPPLPRIRKTLLILFVHLLKHKC